MKTWPHYDRSCIRDVSKLLRKGGSLSAYKANPKFGIGPAKGSWAEKLEALGRKRFSVRHAIAVNSGTAGLHIGLCALGVGGSNVITTPLSFSATPSAVVLAGASPVFCDVEGDALISPATIQRTPWHGVRAIVPVALFGQWRPFKMPGHRLFWDAAQAVGTVSGKGMGEDFLAAVSFNGGKQVPAGECGMLLTNSDDYAHQARRLMNHGENFLWDEVGYNYRPNELTCCVAWHGLDRIEERLKQRTRLAEILRDGMMSDGVMMRHFVTPNLKGHALYVFNFEIEGVEREAFCNRLMQYSGVSVQKGYIQPTLDKYRAFKRFPSSCPDAHHLSSTSLCLFTHVQPGRTERDMMKTLKGMRKAVTG